MWGELIGGMCIRNDAWAIRFLGKKRPNFLNTKLGSSWTRHNHNLRSIPKTLLTLIQNKNAQVKNAEELLHGVGKGSSLGGIHEPKKFSPQHMMYSSVRGWLRWRWSFYSYVTLLIEMTMKPCSCSALLIEMTMKPCSNREFSLSITCNDLNFSLPLPLLLWAFYQFQVSDCNWSWKELEVFFTIWRLWQLGSRLRGVLKFVV